MLSSGPLLVSLWLFGLWELGLPSHISFRSSRLYPLGVRVRPLGIWSFPFRLSVTSRLPPLVSSVCSVTHVELRGVWFMLCHHYSLCLISLTCFYNLTHILFWVLIFHICSSSFIHPDWMIYMSCKTPVGGLITCNISSVDSYAHVRDLTRCFSIHVILPFPFLVINIPSQRCCHICWTGDPKIGSRGLMTRGPNITFEARDRSQVRPRDVMSGLTVPNMINYYLVIPWLGLRWYPIQ